MGSPLGLILSNIYEERLVTSSTIRPLAYTRYLDVTFWCTIKTKQREWSFWND